MNIAICFSARIFQKPQISPNCLDVLRAAMVRSFSDGNVKRTKHFVDDVMYVSGNKQVHHIQPTRHPAWGRGTPFRLCSSLVHSLHHLLLFITFSLFPFLIHFTYFLLLSILSLSTRIVPLRFQARGRRRRPNLGLVCLIYDCVICIA